MNWFISDTHFCHQNIIKFESRPYKNSEEMNKDMIKKWNEKVKNGHHVYIVGDFSFGNVEETATILQSLNGIKHLIKGNHDYSASKLRHLFASIQDYKEIKIDVSFQSNKLDVILFHYPLESWNKSHHSSVNIYGHVHSYRNAIGTDFLIRKPKKNAYNASADIHGLTPVSFEELVENNKKWVTEIWGN